MAKGLLRKATGTFLTLAVIMTMIPNLCLFVMAEDESILTNGDFEYADTAALKADFGYGSPAVRDNYISLSQNGGRNSSKALYYGTGGSDGWAARALYRTVNVKPNTDYKWTMWVKFSSTASYLAGLAVTDNSEIRIDSIITPPSGGGTTSELLGNFNVIRNPSSGKWLQYTAIFNSGNNLKVRLYYTQYKSTISAYLDDWALSELSQSNLLMNGNFEQGSLAGYTNGATVNPSIEANTVYEGDYSAKCTSSANGWSTGKLYFDVAVEQNTNYVWSLWMYFGTKPSDSGHSAAGLAVTDTSNSTLLSSVDALTYDSGSIVLGSSLLAGWILQMRNPSLGEWHKYSVSFNSGNNQTIRLTYMNYNTQTTAYLDDWVLQEELLSTGDFEYADEQALKSDFTYGSTAVRDNYISLSSGGGRNGSKALYYGTGGYDSWMDGAIYKTVTVEPDTRYVWTLWIKFGSSHEYAAGLAIADSNGKRIDSSITAPEGGGSISSNLTGIFNGIANPIAGTWRMYSVSFYSGDNTSIRLSYTQYHNQVSAYLDDWSLYSDRFSKTVYLDNTQPVQSNYNGFGGIYHGYTYMPDSTRDKYTEVEAQLEFDRIAAAGVTLVRTKFYQSWAWNSNTNMWDWNSERMRSFYKWLDEMDKRGIDVAVNMAWSYNEICQTTSVEGYENPFAYLAGNNNLYDCLEYYGEWAVDTVNEVIINRGHTNVKYFMILTEPNNHGYGSAEPNTQDSFFIWRDVIKAVHDEMTANGVRNMVQFVGPNSTLSCPSFLNWAVEYADDYIDIYSYHKYGEFSSMNQDRYDYWADWADDVLAVIESTGKPYWNDETNTYRPFVGLYESKQEPWHGTQVILSQIALMNAGIERSLLWSLTDQKWPDRLLGSEVAASWEDGIHRCGILRDMKISATPYLGYYAYSMVGKYIKGLGSKVYQGIGGGGVYLTMVEMSDGNVTIIAVNMNGDSRAVNYELGEAINKTLYRHVFNPEETEITAQAKTIETSGTFANVKSSFSDIVPAGGVTVYTSIRDKGHNLLPYGDFGYENETAMKADFGYGSTAVCDSYISLSQNEGRNSGEALNYGTGGTDAWSARALYRTVEVKPNTEYKWTSWVKFSATDTYVAGLAIADNSGTRVESSIIPSIGGGTMTSGLLGIFKGIQNPTASQWLQYTVAFNSGNNSEIRLCFTQYKSTISACLDDWWVEEAETENLISNGDMETNSFTGYVNGAYVTPSIDTEIVHGGNYSSKCVTSTDGWSTSKMYYDAPVEQNTDYIWSLWINFGTKPTNPDHSAAGLAVTDTSNSTLLSSVDALAYDSSSIVLGDSLVAGWILQMKDPALGEWYKYTVSFNSGNNQTVRLTYMNHNSQTTAYLDDWLLQEAPVLANSNMETGTTAGYSSGSYASPSIDSKIFHGGDYSLKCTSSQSDWVEGRVYYEAAVEEYTDYIWSIWMNFDSKPADSSEWAAGFGVSNTMGTGLLSCVDDLTYQPNTIICGDSLQSGWIIPVRDPFVGQWYRYTIRFNSGNNNSVRLTYINYNHETSVYLDDWELYELDEILTTGDFDYTNESAMKADFEYGSAAVRDNYVSLSLNGGRNSSKALFYNTGGANGWALRSIYKTVTVEENTDYIWTSWVKFSSSENYVAGIAVADNTGARIDSTITTSSNGGSVSTDVLGIYNAIQNPSPGEWIICKVRFNSGNNTSIRLCYSQCQSTISAYSDDWSLIVN